MQKDIHAWTATYNDGATVPEFDADRPDGRGFAEVDSTQVAMLTLGPHRVAIPVDASPVFFRRRKIEVDTQKLTTVRCIGWKRETCACYLFIFDDGRTLLTSDYQAV